MRLAFLRAVAFSVVMASMHSWAGSRGYDVVAVDIGDSRFFESQSWNSFIHDGVRQLPIATACWRKGAAGEEGIHHITRKKLPNGITVELARSIWSGDKSAALEAQKILKKRDEFNRPEGYDGMYVLNASDGKISLMSLGTNGRLGPKNPSKKITISWNDDSPQDTAAQLDLAMCRLSKPLDVGFGV